MTEVQSILLYDVLREVIGEKVAQGEIDEDYGEELISEPSKCYDWLYSNYGIDLKDYL